MDLATISLQIVSRMNAMTLSINCNLPYLMFSCLKLGVDEPSRLSSFVNSFHHIVSAHCDLLSKMRSQITMCLPKLQKLQGHANVLQTIRKLQKINHNTRCKLQILRGQSQYIFQACDQFAHMTTILSIQTDNKYQFLTNITQ